MSEDDLRDVWVITVSDGTMFWCEPAWFGEGRERHNHRWRIRGKGVEYVGPIVQADRSAEAVRVLVEQWWQDKKDLGQAGVNAEILRGRILGQND